MLIAARHVVVGQSDARTVRPAALHIDGSTIRTVELIEPNAYSGWVDEHPEVLDLGDRLLSPAFINAHTHVVLGFLRGVAARAAAEGNLVEDLFFRLETKLTAEAAAAFARMGAYECLLHGQALVWDHYYHAEAVADAVADVGLSVVMAPTLQDLSGPGCQQWSAALAATERLAARSGRRGVWAAVGPHATDTVSADLWARAADLAQALSLPLHAHLAQSVDEYRRIHDAHGCSPVAWLSGLEVLSRVPAALLVHGLYVSGDDLDRLDPARDVLGFCPYSQLVFGFEARVDLWQGGGFRVAAGTDASASNDSMNVQKELRALGAIATRGVPFSAAYERFIEAGDRASVDAVAAARDSSFSAVGHLGTANRVLDAVWTVPGALHPGFRAGVLEPGALAHLAAWNLDHPAFWPSADPLAGLAFADTSQALHGLWVGGQAVGTLGRFGESLLSSDAYRTARREADEHWRGLLDP